MLLKYALVALGVLCATPFAHASKTMVTSCYSQRVGIAAHKTLTFGTVLRLAYRGSIAFVTIHDRGPFVRGRDLDISCKLAKEMGFLKRGVAPVRVSVVRK